MGKLCKNIFRYISICVCLVLFAGLFSACSLGEKEDNTYAVTGYVYDEFGDPVEGVLISSNIASATTDKDGKYIISGIENSIILSPSKTGYKFDEISKMISSKTDNANFLAYKEYQINGVAHNNGVALAGANVIINSLSGTFYTMTDENGSFVVSGVAGESTVNCEVDSLQFYEVKTTIDNPNVQILTTSSLTIEFEFDTNDIDYSKIELYVNGEKLSLSSSKKVIEDINCGAVVELKSDTYHFNRTSKFIVSSLNQKEVFSCSKIYSLTGSVKSGDVALGGSSLLLDGKFLSYVGDNGNFAVSGLFGEHTLTAELFGFEFSSQVINQNVTNVDFVGTKTVNVTISTDFDNGTEFNFGLLNYEMVEDFKFKLQSLEVGQTISLSSEDYHLNCTQFEIDDRFEYIVDAKALYSVNIIVEEIEGIEYLLDGNVVEAGSFTNLYGTHNVSAKYEDYIFETAEVDFENTEATLEYLVPYIVNIKVVSGEISISNATISIGNTAVVTDINGEAVIEGLVQSNTISVSANGYNSAEIEVFEASSKVVELSYDIDGYVLVGNNPVMSAEVSIGEKKVETDENGYFEFKQLFGECSIEIKKELYSFENKAVTKQTTLSVGGTYSISGNVSIEGEPVSGYLIHLRNIKTGDELIEYTDANGDYSFIGLSEIYFLYATSASGAVELKPVSYTITGAGRYSFSSSGYSVSGYIKTGNVPIANVKVIAGSDSVYTDSNGYYCFELLTQECSIYAEKDGYTFSGAIDVSDNSSEANFSASYEIKGKIVVNSVALAGVKVTIGDRVVYTNENGEYSLSGIEGEVSVSFEKEGYEFTSSGSVSGNGEIEVSSKVVSTAIVKTGDIQVFDYECYIGNEKQSVENGVAKFTAEKGTVVTFVKDGYTISSIAVTEPKQYVATATYSISGKTMSGSVAVQKVYVYLNETQIATTNSNGEFSISGLSGANTLTFAKTGFAICDVSVNGAKSDIVANATFKVYGTISVGSRTLDGVKVLCNGNEAITANDGKFEFTQISGTYGLTFEKDGYTFENVTADKFGEQKFVVEASYSISGVVKSGNLIISGATIIATLESTGTEIETVSNENGEFLIQGIKGIADIIVSKDGYLTTTILGFSDISTNVSANLKYNVTINFDVEGVTVYVNANKQVVTNKVLSLTGLQGENTLRFELANTSFSQNNVKVRQPGVLNISSTKSYTISGYVNTDTGLAVSNVIVASNAGDEAVTDSNGRYEFANVAGSISIKDDSITKETKNITADGEYNFVISNSDFAYMLYVNAYKNFDNAQSLQMFGTGEVVGDAGVTKTTQYVYSLMKKDNNGNYIKQNLNYGDSVFGVDPKVSLVTYLQASTGVVKYEMLEDGNVTGKTSANHNVSNFTSVSASDYKTKFGEGITDYGPYDITKSKITGYSTVSLNSSGNYVFTLTLSTSQAGYATRIEALSGVDFQEFTSIQLTYEITKTGWLTKLDACDKYTIKQGVSVSIVSNVSYIYYTNKANLKIDDLSISTNDALTNSLKKSSQTELEVSSVSATNYACGNIVSQVIYGK